MFNFFGSKKGGSEGGETVRKNALDKKYLDEALHIATAQGADSFQKYVDQLERRGFSNTKELIASPEVVSAVKKVLLEALSSDTGFALYALLNEKWEQLGVAPLHPKDPEVMHAVHKNLLGKLSAPANFLAEVKRLEVAGFTTFAEAVNIPEVKRIVLDKVLPFAGIDLRAFKDSIRSWEDAGIVTTQEALRDPEIQKAIVVGIQEIKKIGGEAVVDMRIKEWRDFVATYKQSLDMVANDDGRKREGV